MRGRARPAVDGALMPLQATQVQDAIRDAVADYGGGTMGQTWLKPTGVLAIDRLVPHLEPRVNAPSPFLCVNGMETNRRGPAWDWRREIHANLGGSFFRNMRLYRHECLVDMNLMVGADDPYETLLTAESEGHAAHGRTVAQVVHASENDFLWDFYKLLMVPSPVRIMFTLCFENNQGDLVGRLGELVNRYDHLPLHLDSQCDIWSISFPTTSMRRTPVRIHRWAPGAHAHLPLDHSILAC